MSKNKLRLKNKYIGSKNHSPIFWDGDRHEIKFITYFDNEVKDIYLKSIELYNQYPYKTHRLWVEQDSEDCSLMVEFNQGVIRDLAPFWAICDTGTYLLGTSQFKYYDFDSMEEAFNYYYSNYEYAEYYTPREKYLRYRVSKSKKETFEYQIKKVSFSNIKSRKKYLNFQHYSPMKQQIAMGMY